MRQLGYKGPFQYEDKIKPETTKIENEDALRKFVRCFKIDWPHSTMLSLRIGLALESAVS
jgi:hypothetical protein